MDYFHIAPPADQLRTVSSIGLAHVGDGVYELTTIEGNLNSTVRRINYRYDATPKRQYYNMSAVPEDEITEENCQYKLQKDDWYVTGFCATW